MASGGGLEAILRNNWRSLGCKGQTFERDILAAFGLLSEELQKLFPPPEKAQGHAERVASLTAILDKVGQVIVGVLVQHGVDEDETREKWVQFESVVLDVFVLMGDLAEQHPIISSMILSVVMYEIAGIPQGAGALFARSLLHLFGLGPAGPTKNSLAAWAQSLFFGPAISKGSWFAKLQKISMTPAKL
ncbi:unnamed protein product [Mycena citricolor]|uniref:Uncharacterized protein n=1 Tax=Mycena citricolor TaxID=2018698 RepID=A0AAD2HK65_9AGAR|nr:unnamed protein product [Mycena citricolor]